jgi:pyruvate/2-oxoglutarate dehydrogenase complex dihydrolipoamide acyltransferase (E2) component
VIVENTNKGINVTIQTIVVPDLGGAETVDVIELGLSPGDSIEIEDSLLVLESDKATMDIPSPAAGALVKYLVAEGATVKVGDAIAEIEVRVKLQLRLSKLKKRKKSSKWPMSQCLSQKPAPLRPLPAVQRNR